MTKIKIHICIESQGDETNKKITLENFSKQNIEVTHTIYSEADVCDTWCKLASLPNDTYLLFVKEGDKLDLGNIDIEDNKTDLYIFSPDTTEEFPRINVSPYSLSSFYENRYNNTNFLIRADWAKKIYPDTKFSDGWLMDIVISMLHIHNAYASRINGCTVTPDSPSYGISTGYEKIIMKIMPSKLGYNMADQNMITTTGARKRYEKICISRIKRLKMGTGMLTMKRIVSPKKYKQFFQAAVFKSKYASNWNKIPIIINNYNRLEYLLKLITSLEKRGVTNIHILDNNSTYPPLLEYYKNTKYKVHYLGENLGYRALWKSNIFDMFKDDYYVYTDPDLVIDDSCPDDFMKYFMSLHMTYKNIWKVGFTLRIDDLPDCFAQHSDVRNWERQFWEVEAEKNVYHAPIDTTFAIYKPFGISDNGRSLRVGGQYRMQHLPWYADSENPSQEDIYYLNHCAKKVHWSNLTKNSHESIGSNTSI